MKGTSQEPNQWTKKSMRSFMESFAKRRNLDPLSPSTWYNLYSPFMKTRVFINSSFYIINNFFLRLERKYAASLKEDSFVHCNISFLMSNLITKHSTDVRNFIISLFHFFLLLIIIIAAIWTDVSDRRKFFEKFAFDNGFDPLVSDNWYSQSKDQIMATKVIIICHLLYY